jgi:hypothetical protein
LYEDSYNVAQEFYDSLISASEEVNELYETEIEKLKNVNSLLTDGISLYNLVNKGISGSTEFLKEFSSALSEGAIKSVEYASAELD